MAACTGFIGRLESWSSAQGIVGSWGSCVGAFFHDPDGFEHTQSLGIRKQRHTHGVLCLIPRDSQWLTMPTGSRRYEFE
jgi:hypothetical protein